MENLNKEYYKVVLKTLLGHLPKARRTDSLSELLEILQEEIEKSMKEDIRSSVLITSISKKEGKNFYLPNEGLLSEEEVRELVNDLSGVFLKSGQNIFILKIKNNKLFDIYKDEIIKQGFDFGIDVEDLLRKVGLEFNKKIEKIYIKDYSNIALFLLINHFVLYALKEIISKNITDISYTSDILLEILDILEKEKVPYAIGVFTVLTKQKKRKYYIPSLSKFILRFYKLEIKNNQFEKSVIGSFLFSFYTYDNDYRDKLLGLLDKFLYYLIFKLKVNFELLCKLLLAFYDFLSKKDKNLKLKDAKEFYIMMNLEKVYNWAYSIGKTIQDVTELSEKEKKDFINRIIKEIGKEELPGRFLEELAKALYKVSEKIKKKTGKEIKLFIHPDVAKKDYYGDDFYRIKAAILSGLINSL